MFKLFRVKRKIEVQADEYVAWKKTRGCNVSKSISIFLKTTDKIDIESIRPDDIQNFYIHLRQTMNAGYFIQEAMKDVRVMFRWFKCRKFNVIDPDVIGEEGLTFIRNGGTLPDMTVKTRFGRPPKVELIKKVKSLRDLNKLSFREIARVVNKDVSQVHVWYYYNLTE